MLGSRFRWHRTAGALALAGAVFGGVVIETISAGAASGLKASAPGSPRPRSRWAWSPRTRARTRPTRSRASRRSFKARIDLQNAEGGVDGRKIKFITEDDQSSPSDAATAAAAEVAKGVFAIDYNSPFAYGAARTSSSRASRSWAADTTDPSGPRPQLHEHVLDRVRRVHATRPATRSTRR